MDEIIDILMSQIKEQHSLRLDGCGGDEVQESFEMLKDNIIEKLIDLGVRDFKTIGKIQNWV